MQPEEPNQIKESNQLEAEEGGEEEEVKQGYDILEACSYRRRSLSKISIFGCHISKITKNGEQDYSPFGQSLVEIEFRSPSISISPTSESPPRLIILTPKQHQ